MKITEEFLFLFTILIQTSESQKKSAISSIAFWAKQEKLAIAGFKSTEELAMQSDAPPYTIYIVFLEE